MKKQKYLLVPGFITQVDGVRHYVNVDMLLRMYEVEAEECVVWKDGYSQKATKHLIRLTPRADGNYEIPK